MKPQDIAFVALLFILIYRFQPKLTAFVGICCLVASIPLFAFWIFFTAERLTMYAAGFFLLSIIQYVMIERRKKK